MQPVYQTAAVDAGIDPGRAKTLKGLGVTVGLFGLIMLALDAVAVSKANEIDSPVFITFYYSGIWGGILYLIAGVMGILAGTFPKQSGWVGGTIASSIVAAVAGISACGVQAAAAVLCSIYLIGDALDTSSTYNCTSFIYTLHSVISSISFINFIIVIVLSSLSCCGGGQRTRSTTVVMANVPPAYGF